MGELCPTLEMKVTFPKVPDMDDLFDVPRGRFQENGRVPHDRPSGRYWDVKFAGYTTDRDRFDKFLSEKAMKAGAEVRHGARHRSGGDRGHRGWPIERQGGGGKDGGCPPWRAP